MSGTVFGQCGYFLTNETDCYIAAQFQPGEIGDSERAFNLGDGKVYGGYFNQVLVNGKNYYVQLAVQTAFPVSHNFPLAMKLLLDYSQMKH